MPVDGKTGMGPAMADEYSFGMAGKEYQKAYAAVNVMNWDGTTSFYDFTEMSGDEIRNFLTNYHVNPCKDLTFGHLQFMLKSKNPVKALYSIRAQGQKLDCDIRLELFLSDGYKGEFSRKVIAELQKINSID